MIFCCVGTGGLFLTSVFAQMLGFPVKSILDKSGHAHNMGKGNWREARSEICLIGDHWETKYRPNCNIYYTHRISDKFLPHISTVEPILIETDPRDYRKVTELYVKKAWPDIWNEQEYQKWAGPDYPPYSPDNIPNSDIIVNDLVTDFTDSVVTRWHQDNSNIAADYRINFRTIMGIDGKDLIDDVCKILGKEPNEGIRSYVQEYQKLNQKLYFEDYH